MPWLWQTVASAALCLTHVSAQFVQASNGTDLGTAANNPRYIVSPTGNVNFTSFEIQPLPPYSFMARQQFLLTEIGGILVNVNPSNVNQVGRNWLMLVSCDPAAYAQSNIGVDGIVNAITNTDSGSTEASIILYSTSSNHCNATGLGALSEINGIFTTVDPVAAALVANRSFTLSSNVTAQGLPDPSSYTNSSSTGGFGSSGSDTGAPNTAIAMIILYSITGIITALFVLIVVLGAIRAHRHPERYGPRAALDGRGRRSRAKGIARAMLETLPIVKFGDDPQTQVPKNGDVELTATSPTGARSVGENPALATKAGESSTAGADKKHAIVTTTQASDEKEDFVASSSSTVVTAAAAAAAATSSSSAPTSPVHHQDSADDTAIGASASHIPSSPAHVPVSSDEGLSCSICTEDFQKQEDVRVLPCNHKFHPECVDPWLLNVSGTCPLCRIDLRTRKPATENDVGPVEDPSSARRWSGFPGHTALDGEDIPVVDAPAQGRIAQLRAVVGRSREERIAALRRFRAERRNRQSMYPSVAQRPSSMVPSTTRSRPNSPTTTRPEQESEDVVTGGEDSRSLAARLRDTLRVRTRRHDGEGSGDGEVGAEVRNVTQNESGVSEATTPATPSSPLEGSASGGNAASRSRMRITNPMRFVRQ